MKRKIKNLIIVFSILMIGGCAQNADVTPEVSESPEAVAEPTEENADENRTDDKAADTADEQISDEEESPEYAGNFTYAYSTDKSVYIRQDYDKSESVIIDGDAEIPVDIAMGVYGPLIEKFDADGDGQDEYLIAECEGTGTGFCIYGLCIVKNTDDGFKLTKYEGKYFTDYLNENIGFRFNGKTNEVSVFEIGSLNSDRYEGYETVLDRKENLEKIVWSDIIRIEFEDGKIYMKAPSGYVFEDSPMPDYEQAAEVTCLVKVNEDLSISLIVVNIDEDDGVK